ncbi:MAG: MtrB/PioB family outer membrane beta-barrel protein [Acidobacteriota bacterium]
MRKLLCVLIALPLMALAQDAGAGAQGAPAQAPKTEEKKEAAPAAAAQGPAAEEAPKTEEAAPARFRSGPVIPPAPGGEPAATDSEKWLTGSFDVGYRFMTDVGGDFNTYRSVVNLGEGPKLFNADFTIQPADRRWADRVDIHASSWGGDPYNTLRVDARKQGLYNFLFDYRNIAYFNFLPSYANPGRINTALPFRDQYGFDITRRVADLELELFPGRRIIPYVAYSRNGGRGDGTSNFILDSNEYTVPTHYSDHTNEFRGGVRLEYNRWHATFEGGGSNFRDDQALFQGSVLPNTGNQTALFLGRQLQFDGGSANYGIRGGAAFARALFTANPASWVDVSAAFLFSQPHTDIQFTQAATGTLFSLANAAFFDSALLNATGKATEPNPSGNVNIELRPFNGRLRILESWMTNRLHTSGASFLVDQFLLTGSTPTAQDIANAELFVANYNQNEINLLFDVTKSLTARGGYRYVWGDTSAPATFLLEGQGIETERGVLRRNVALAGLSYRWASVLRANVDVEVSPGDRSYFRTSLNDYKRVRTMARWQARTNLEVTARYNVLDNQNPDPLIRYDFRNQDATLSAQWSPTTWKGFGVLGEYSYENLRSNIIYIIPNQFTPDLSLYNENAHMGTLLADIPTRGGRWPKLSFGGSFFRSSGTRPTRYWQPLARVGIPICPHAQFNAEWRWYGMSQPFYLFEGFRSHQFITSLRFTL